MHGILLVDKPEGVTSNKVVGLVKRLAKPAKVGHTGTLDPAATGLVVILIGAVTRALDFLDESRKEYSLTVMLGEESDTDDRDGEIVRTGDASRLTSQDIEEVLQKYRGVVDQVPPLYSAIKKNGVPLYKLAREGIHTEVKSRKVEIFSLTLTSWSPPLLDLQMICSKGTYARSLARDLGRDLHVGGRLDQLRRVASGPFKVENSVPMDDLTAGGTQIIEANLLSLSQGLAHIPDLTVLPNEVRKLMQGNAVKIPRSRLIGGEGLHNDQPRLLKIVSGGNGLVIIVRPEPIGVDLSIRPVRVFNMWGGT